MAIVTPTQADKGDGYGGAILYTWVLTTADHTGAALGAEIIQHADLCWQASGTWGGATAAIEGSNNDSVYGAMTNVSGGSAITWTADGAPKQQIERPVNVRPRLSTVGLGATVTVTLLARRNQLARKA